MKLYKTGNHAVEKNHADGLLKGYEYNPINMKGLHWVGTIRKAEKDLKIIPAPLSMAKLLNIAENDEYHGACVSAIAESSILKVKSTDSKADDFLKSLEIPGNESISSTLTNFIFNYAACGNGFLVKLRNLKKEWVGLSILSPAEMQLAESYDDYGFLSPLFIQVKNQKRTLFENKDIIHYKKMTYKSNAWGLNSAPVILSCEILKEIKTYNYNRFKNGLLIDYFVIVEGGSLGEEETYTDDQGNEITVDPFSELVKSLEGAKGTKDAHGVALIESKDNNVKIRLEPMRSDKTDFKQLKDDLRDGIFVYHRVPHRLVSTETSGKLGGDNNSDLTLFYITVIKPIQKRLAYILAQEINREFGWKVDPDSFDFGDISELAENIETKISKKK